MSAGRVLVVDDEKNIRSGLAEALSEESFEVDTAVDGRDALAKLDDRPFDLVITDLKMPNMGGDELLSEIVQRFPATQTIILTAHGDINHAVETMARGAYTYLTKPPNLRELMLTAAQAVAKGHLIQENSRLLRQSDGPDPMKQMVGQSEQMARVFDIVRTVAPTNASVLITGENGTGKEMIAKALHSLSQQRERKMISVHCAALNENLLESELFGHEKGAFTGAMSRRRGRFELAHESTLFMDEIGEISTATQVKLLRVLQERTFERVGGDDTIRSDFRLITATNRKLHTMAQNGEFREDLFYRIAVVNIELPPLRDRTEDIPFLISDFLKEFAEKNNRKIPSISTGAIRSLQRYRWPGNIRELRNVVEGLIVMTRKTRIDEADLPDYLREPAQERAHGTASLDGLEGLTLAEAEMQLIHAALKRANGNKSEAARALGIGRKTLQRKLANDEGAGDDTDDEESDA